MPFQVAKKSWYNCSVNFELNEEELQIFNAMCQEKEYRGYKESTLISLPMSDRAKGIAVGIMIRRDRGNVFMAKDNIELCELEDKINETAKSFKKLLTDYMTIKSFNSEDRSGDSSFKI